MKRIKNYYHNQIMKKIGREEARVTNNKKVMFAFCFTWYDNCMYHDYLLAQSLRLRGAEIVPVVCGGIQSSGCPMVDGKWLEGEFKDSCKKCKEKEKRAWKKWGNLNPIDAKTEINPNELNDIQVIVKNLKIENYKEWSYCGAPIGMWCFDFYRNNSLCTEIELDEAFENKMRLYAQSMCILIKTVESIIIRENPDIIYSNDSFYYPGAAMEFFGKKYNIPFYNGYCIGRVNTYSYAKDEPVLALNLEKLWKNYIDKPLTSEEDALIENYLNNRHLGLDMNINTANPLKSINEIKESSIYGKIRKGIPTALLATNVTWDAAALNKDKIFEGLIKWVLNTVDYFEKHIEFQLVIRPHPAEISNKVPEAIERIAQIILNHFKGKLPDNIIIIDADAPMSIYELYPIADIGLIYTSTVGLEMASLGKAVITAGHVHYAGKGFTYDPEDVISYFSLIDELLSRKISEIECIRIAEQSKKYFYLYYFKFLVPIKWYSYKYLGGVKLNINSAKMLLPGNDECLDYICDAILNGKEIFDDDRMPPIMPA